MNGHHKTVFIFIVYFNPSYWLFGKEAGIVGNHVPSRSGIKLVQIALFNNIYGVVKLSINLTSLCINIELIASVKFFSLNLLYIFDDVPPIRHLFKASPNAVDSFGGNPF